MRRLGHHPSIVMWSGNNENQDEGTRTSGNLVDYTALYDDTVRATLWEEVHVTVYVRAVSTQKLIPKLP